MLAVQSVETSSRYYQDVLGFEETLAVGDDWRFLSHGSCRIMLGQCVDEVPAGETGNHSYFAYWDVDDAAAIYESWKEKGAEILKPLTDESWGQREFTVRTPDGHRITVGEDIA
ncbi:MAG: VOC family protein [Armatimonadetes bacterium]|nr:VOC family protein [Armatimonadota bacterium]